MKKVYLYLLPFFCILLLHEHAYAADTIPWDTALDTMTSAIQTIARPIVAIMVAVSGMMYMFGTSDGAMKTAIRLTLGIGLALQVADIVTGSNSLFPDMRDFVTGNVEKPTFQNVSLTGSDKGINFIGNFMTYYENMCIYGASLLMPHAFKVLAALTIINMTLDLIFKLEGDHVKYLLHQIIKVSFFIFLIQNWIGGTGALANFANTIFTSFEKLGIIAAGGTGMQPENILANGFQVIADVSKMFEGSILKGNLIMYFTFQLCGIFIFLCVAITALQLILTRLEFWTVALILVPIIPFGVFKHTRFLFERAIGAIFNLGIKMAVVSFICIIASPMIKGLVSQVDDSWTLSAVGTNIVLMFTILFGTLLLAVMAWKIPAMAAGLLNGQPSLSGGDMFEPIKSAASVANTAGRVAGTMMQASNMAGGATALNTINKAGGPQTGWSMRQMGTIRNLGKMANQAYNPFSQGYNDGQKNVRDRMQRNVTNSEKQNNGKRTEIVDNEIRAGWQPETENRKR